MKRLKNIGKIPFTEEDIIKISKASEIRNRIVHYEFDLNATETKLIFAKLLGFLSQFHTLQLDNSLDTIISEVLWQKAVSILEYSEELYKRAQDIFKEQGIDELFIWECKHCGWEAFVIQEDINTCYVCGYKGNINECPGCNNLFYADDCFELQTGDEEYELFCIDCYESKIRNDERYYREMMSHLYYK